ncbi:MAG: chorismate synthase, partial [Chthoniobacterales bacterium]
MSSIAGQLFRIATWGESHGGGIGVVIDGCLPQISLTEADIQKELDRRRPGQSDIVTPRKEADRCEILSGVFQGKTLGTPIAILVRNEDARPEAYSEMETTFRPSHADFTYEAKYGIRNWQGGGRASARETIGRVAAGVVARKVLEALHPGIDVLAWVSRVHQIESNVDPSVVNAAAIEANAVRCPDAAAAEKMIARIKEARSNGDSVGGLIECVVRNCPLGLGEPAFDK